MYFPIWKSIYSNLHFNNTKAKLFRSIVDEYYKPLHMKFFKIMYIYSQSKSFALLPSFKLETIVGFVTKQRHTSRFLTEFTSCNGKMPCYSLPCWEISWPDEVHHFFLRIRNPRVTTVTAFNKSMAEVNCVSLKDIRTFCHATRFRFSHKILKVSSVDSLLFLSELHLTLQLRFNFKESRLHVV